MKTGGLNILIAMFLVFSLIISIGAEGNIVSSSEDFSIEKVENINQVETGIEEANTGKTQTVETMNHLSEEDKIEGERIESLTPDNNVDSENLGAETGQKEEAPISSQNIEENIDYVHLEEVLNETRKNNETKEEKQETFSNKSQNQEEVGSGQEQEVEKSPGQNEVVNEINNEKNETIQENHTDVRGNTQKDTGSSDSLKTESNEKEPVSLSSSETSGSSGSSESSEHLGSKVIEYLNLSEIIENYEKNKNNTNANSTNNTEKNNENIEESKEQPQISVTKLYSEDRERIVERTELGKIKIDKEEIRKNEFEKRIIVSSETHVEGPIQVETSLEVEVTKDKIKIFWENENLDITNLEEFSIKYYDENDNGLVDRVSWIVPHLSTQTFKFIVTPEFIEKSSAIGIELKVEGPEGPVTNPIEFNISLNYSHPQFVTCSLRINSSTNTSIIEKGISFSENGSIIENYAALRDGDYKWYLNCQNQTGNISTGKSKGFSISEGFMVSNITDRLFFLDLVKNEIKNTFPLTFSSNHLSKKEVILKKDSNIIFTKNYGLGKGELLTLNKTLLNSSGIYNLTIKFIGENSVNKTISQIFSVASANIEFTPGTYDINEKVEIKFGVKSPNKNIISYFLELGDSYENPIFNMNYNQKEISSSFQQSFSYEGNKEIKLKLQIQGENYFEIEKSGIKIENKGDSSAPDISLIYPKHNAIIYDDTITFEYEVTDNVKVKNCTFRLYNDSSEDEFENVRETDKSIANGDKIKVPVVKFESGEYLWYVECFDNSSNSDWEVNSFEVILDNSTNKTISSQFTDYEQREEVEDVIGEVNAFLLDEEDFEADIKEVLEDLGISEDIEFYKKRLLQIDQYFKENYKYVDTEELRKQKDKEYLEEFENIKNKIPKEIEIIDSFEYVKNSVEVNLEEIVQDYMKSTNTQISNSFARKLAQENLKLQQKVSVEANVKQVKIEYANETKEIFLVKKKVDLEDSEEDQILEIIPKDITENAEEVIFLVDNQIIKQDPIFEILTDDLTDNNEIVYYIDYSLEKDLKPHDFSKTETILFEEAFKGNSGVTGFFAADIITLVDPVYLIIAIILLISLIILFLFVFRKRKVQNWKKEPNVVKCFELLGKANLYIKEKDLERARENYRELKRIYPVLPSKPKDYFYEKIKELAVEIDKRDIFALVKEYEEARKHWNKEDCLRIYKDIKKVYERLPIKYRQKIYERINKY